MFIIDLDDTLLDTQASKQFRQESLESIGVSEEIFKKSYKEAYENKDGINIYSSESHARVLAGYGFNEGEILAVLKKVEANFKNFLFPGVKDFLNFLKEKGQKLVLLSLGEQSFQKIKIKETGIENYFDKIFTVNDTKEHVVKVILADFSSEQETWFINDKIEETKKLKQMFPVLKPVLKISPVFSEQEYKQSGLPHFQTLTEIKQYVASQIG